MLLFLASIADQVVNAGVAHLRALGHAAEVITAHDLAQPGWTLTIGGAPTLVVGGAPVPARAVTAVITRIAGVTTAELPFIHAEDRDYAAAEMQAFLVALLTSLTCPVLNRPTPASLCGPAWSREQWVLAAARAGVPVATVTRRAYAGGAVVRGPAEPPRRIVHVVGETCAGDPDPALHAAAVAVARAAGTELLRVAFDATAGAPRFLDADTWIDVADLAVATALHERLA
jgi:hypothetical protein